MVINYHSTTVPLCVSSVLASLSSAPLLFFIHFHFALICLVFSHGMQLFSEEKKNAPSKPPAQQQTADRQNIVEQLAAKEALAETNK